MVNLTLKSNDSIDTVLPSIELAMHTGDAVSYTHLNAG